jgi:hypothetical protein
MSLYDYQRPVGKIEDAPDLRNEFIAVFDAKSKSDTARFGLLYGRHLLELTGFEECGEIKRAFDAVRRWLDGETNYHEARDGSFSLLRKGFRKETDGIEERFYKTVAQLACIPHVKAHGLWASDFAITLINRLYPNDPGAVRQERQKQIDIFRSV